MKIDKKVPIPAKQDQYHKGTKRLLSQMFVGDSIFVGEKREINSLRVTAHLFAAESGRKHITKKVEGGWRLWRTE